MKKFSSEDNVRREMGYGKFTKGAGCSSLIRLSGLGIYTTNTRYRLSGTDIKRKITITDISFPFSKIYSPYFIQRKGIRKFRNKVIKNMRSMRASFGNNSYHSKGFSKNTDALIISFSRSVKNDDL